MKPDLTPISRIDKDFVGLKTKISGQVIDFKEHANGHVFLKVKDDSGGVISVPIFDRIHSKLEKKIELLDNIQVLGKVKEYQGDLELIPEKAESIQIIHSTPLELSKISKDDVGETVKIQGTIKQKKNVGSGSLLLELHKNSAELMVFIPRNVSDAKDFPSLQEGDSVKIGGTVQLYEGELELKVNSPYHIQVIGDSQ